MDEMKKYIIEFSEDPHTIRLVKIKNGDKFPITEFKTVKPYTDPDMEKGREEAFKNGYDAACKDIDIKSKINAAYRKGLEDAWECARKIFLPVAQEGLPASAIIQIFGNKPTEYILKDYSGSEAIEKIRAYEQEKEEELGIKGYFKNGEEVIDAEGTKAVILRVSEDNYCQVYTEKGCIENWHIHTYKFHKTGRHFPEIAEVLRKIRGDSDG